MNILVVSQYYYPEPFRITDICEALVARGHSVTVVAGIPNYPEGEIYPGYEGSADSIETRNGVRIIRCNNLPRHKGIVALAKNYITYVRCANRVVRDLTEEFDVVYVYQLSPVTMAIPAIRYAKKHRVPLVMYVLDLWPESIRDMGSGRHISDRGPLFLATKFLSKRIYSQVDLMLVKCREFKDYYLDLGLKKLDYRVLFEHAEDSYLQVAEEPENNGVIDFMFLGNIGASSNCDLIVKAAARLEPTHPFKIHFVGDGSDLERVKQIVRDLDITDRVVFHGRHPRSEVFRFYDLADVCLLTLANTSSIGLTPPGKLPGYMAANRPILASIDGAAKTIIEDADCGLVAKADDVEAFAALMQQVLDDPDRLRHMGANGRKYFLDNFTLDNHVSKFESILRSLVGEDHVTFYE